MSHIDYTMQYGEDEEPKEVNIDDLPHSNTETKICFTSLMTSTRATFKVWNDFATLDLAAVVVECYSV